MDVQRNTQNPEPTKLQHIDSPEFWAIKESFKATLAHPKLTYIVRKIISNCLAHLLWLYNDMISIFFFNWKDYIPYNYQQ